jgi:Yip1 domain
MATSPTNGNRVPLIQRVKNILMTPKTEWPVIDAESDTIAGIYKNYVVILAAIAPICLLIGLLLFGMPYVSFPMEYLLAQAVISYVMALIGCYVLALIIDALAPSFGGTKDKVKAFKVAAYSSTAAWVVGIFYLLPLLAILGIIGGLYSLYLLYLGLPVLMKAPADKSVVYTVAVIVAAIVIYLVLGAITGRILATLMVPTMTLPAGLTG